jgi:DNA-binding LytR/AlgR family response regulator
MEASTLRRIARAYLFSIGIWSALSLLSGWQYLIFDKSLNIHSTLPQMLLLAESRGLAFALLTPPIFYVVRHYASGARHRIRYLFGYLLGAAPFMVLYACARWIIFPPWSPVTQGFVSRRSGSPLALVHDGFADIITIYIAIVFAAHAYNYFERIIDDEPLAQTALAKVLVKRRDVERFDIANDAVEALDKLLQQTYDVLLMDINMPEVSGIELLDRLKAHDKPLPSVVFVTAHEEHAITAFKKHAVDYVLKPFSNERIDEALDVAFRRTAGERAAMLVAALPHLQKLSQQQSARIAIKTKGRILFVDPHDVVSVHADGNYVLLQRDTGSYLLRESISVMAEKLKPYGFVRIHRSVLINASFVEEIKPWPTGEYGLRVKGGKEYTVSRGCKGNLKEIAASWIGVDSFAGQ